MITVEEMRTTLSWEPTMTPAPKPVSWKAWAEDKDVDIVDDERYSVLLRGEDVLARVSNKYHPFSNRDLVRLATEATGEGWGVDSVVEFNNGRTVVVNLIDVVSDYEGHQALVGLVNSFTGKEALRMLPLNRRVFCRNQLPYYSGQRSYRHPHNKPVEFPAGVFASIRADLAHRQAQMEEFQEIRLPFGDFVEHLIDTLMDADTDAELINKRRAQLMMAYEHPTAPEPGTAYAALQAVMLADQKIIGRRGWRTEYGSEMSQLALEMLESNTV